jgi:hypothetical protein
VVAVDGAATARSAGSTPTSRHEASTDSDPAEVTPQRVPDRVAKVTKTAPSRRLRPGDLICGQCGEGNPPTRKFCSRCGEGLTAAEVVKAPWWSRLMFWRRGPRTLEAGARPGRKGQKADSRTRMRGGYRKARTIVGAAVFGLLLVSLVVPNIRTEVNDLAGDPGGRVRDLWGRWFDPHYVPVRPTSYSATHQARGHPGQFAMDIDKQTFWAAPRDRRVKRPALVVTFAEPVDLTHLIVSSGAVEAEFNKYYRPRVLHLVYSQAASEDITLDDVSKDQTFKLKKAKNVSRVTIFISSVFPETTARQVAVRELEFQVLDE